MTRNPTGVDDAWRYSYLKGQVAEMLERQQAYANGSLYDQGWLTALERVAAVIRGLDTEPSTRLHTQDSGEETWPRSA